jgi:hypothetical protein
LFVGTLPYATSAQERLPEETFPRPALEANFTPQAAGNQVWLDLEALPTPIGNFFTATLGFQLQMHPHVVMNLELPGGIGRVFGEPVAHVAPGNITSSVRGIGAVLPWLVLWGGVSLSIPTIWAIPATNDGLAESNVAAYSAAGRLGYDEELFYPENVGVRVSFGLETSFAKIWRYRLDFSSVMLIAVGQDVGPRVNEASVVANVIASSSEFQVEVGGHVSIGARGQAILLLPEFAGGPFVEYEVPGTGVRIRADYLVGTGPSLPYGAVSPWGGTLNSVALHVGYRL